MYLPIKLSSEKHKGIEIVEEGFLDCGATGKFIDQNYAKIKGLKLKTLEKPIHVYNVDGTPNTPATFQAMMDDIFGDMINECIIIVNMDDIFLFAPDEITLMNNTRKVLA
jgi:hypothetical protein